jgi:hypothetical protein
MLYTDLIDVCCVIQVKHVNCVEKNLDFLCFSTQRTSLSLGFKQLLQILKKKVVKKRSNVGLGYYSDSRTRNTVLDVTVIHPCCVYNKQCRYTQSKHDFIL